MIDMNKFQRQINDLQEKFERRARPITNSELIMIKCALGANEESGELAHVILKMITGTYGYDDKEKVKEKATDAIVDMTVFGLQVLNELGVMFEDIFPRILKEVIDRNNTGVEHIPIQEGKQ